MRVKIFSFSNLDDWGSQLNIWLGQISQKIISVEVSSEDSKAYITVSEDNADCDFEVITYSLSQEPMLREIQIRNVFASLNNDESSRLVSFHICYTTTANMGDLGTAKEYFLLGVFEKS